MNEFMKVEETYIDHNITQRKARLVKLENGTVVEVDYKQTYSSLKDSEIQVGMIVMPTLNKGLGITYNFQCDIDYFVITEIIYKSKYHKFFKKFLRNSIDKLKLMYVEVDKNE